jgi:hypothetical protein
MENLDAVFNVECVIAMAIGIVFLILSIVVLVKETWFKKK